MALSKIESDSIASTIDLSGISLTLPDGSVTSSKLDTNIAITGNLTVDTDTLYIDSTNNRVGIGTSSPGVALEVGQEAAASEVKINSAANGGYVSLKNNSTFVSNPIIELQRWTGSGLNYWGVQLEGNNTDFTISNTPTNGAIGSQTFTERMRITSSGNVGIGTSSPSKPLDVSGEIKFTTGATITPSTSNLYATDSTLSSYATTNGVYLVGHAAGWLGLRASGSAATQIIQFGPSHAEANTTKFYTNSLERMRINASGNVGIGTTSQANKLEVSGAIVSQGAVDSYTNDGLYLSNEGSGLFKIGAWRSGANASILTFGTDSGSDAAPVEHVRIDSSGNVGIGTTSPATNLHIADTAVGLRLEDTDVGAYGGLIQSGAVLYVDADLGNYSGGSIRFRTAGGTEAMRVDSNGDLAIGTTTAGAKLRIRGAGTTSATVAVRVDDSSGSILFYVRNDGRYYTGTSSESPANLTTSNAANMYVSPATGILFRSTSSIKYKTDVQDATHGLDDVMKLRAVTYKGKNEEDGDTVFGGLIAEEVHDAGLTEFVQYDDDGNPDALAYGHMVSLAFKAIQEQQELIQELKTRIQALENN